MYDKVVRLIIPYQLPAHGLSATRPFLRRILDRWGGYTSFKGEGFYKSDRTATIHKDSILIVDTSVPTWDTGIEAWWRMLAEDVRKELRQESVYLSVRPEQAYLI